MNEEEFQGLLDQRVGELQSAGEPAEKIQEWINSQWASYDTPEEEEEILEEDTVEAEPSVEPEAPAAPWEQQELEGPQTAEQAYQTPDASERPTSEIENRLVADWGSTDPHIKTDDRKAYEEFKSSGQFDSELLGAETQLQIDAEHERDAERAPKEGESEDDYLKRIRNLDEIETYGPDTFWGKAEIANQATGGFLGGTLKSVRPLVEAFQKNFKSSRLSASADNLSLVLQTNERIKELEDNKGKLSVEDWEQEYNEALAVKSSLQYLAWEKSEEAELFQKSSVAGNKAIDYTDEDGDFDYGKIWEGVKDGSVVEEFITQLPNTVIAGLGSNFITKIPSMLYFGAQMANEYRTKTINSALDKQFGVGKWGEKEYHEYTQSEAGQAAINKAKLYGFGAGQIDRMVDRISTLGVVGKSGKSFLGPTMGKVKKLIGEKAISLLGQPGAKILGGVANFGAGAKALKVAGGKKLAGVIGKKGVAIAAGVGRFASEVQLEQETEHLQEEIGNKLGDDWTNLRSLEKVAAWHLARDAYYSDDEKQQVGNLRAITAITAGPMSGPGSFIQTAGDIKAINQDRLVDKKRMSQADVNNLKPPGASEANKADLQEAITLAEEYEGKDMPPVVQEAINSLVGNVENRNVNNQVIVGEHSEKSLSDLDKNRVQKTAWNKLVEDPNSSDAIRQHAEGKVAELDGEYDEKYFKPLERQQHRDEYKEESRDEFARLDEINQKLLNKDLSVEERKSLHIKRDQYTSEIRGKQTNYQKVDDTNSQNTIDEIRDIRDRRINARGDNEGRAAYKKRITQETNAALGRGFTSKSLSGPQKSRLVRELLETNAGYINKQVSNYKNKSIGTNFASAFTAEDFKTVMETQMIKNAETYDPSKGAKFGTRALSGIKLKAWAVARKLEGGIRDKSRETWGENFVPLEIKDSGGDIYSVLDKSTADDDVALASGVDDSVDNEGSYDQDTEFERDGISGQTQALLNHVHGLDKDQVESFDDLVLKEITSGVESGDLNIVKGEGQFITKLNKKVRGPIMTHLNDKWGASFKDQLGYLEDNFDLVNGVLPAHARNGKFLDGLFQDPDVALDEVLAYMQSDTDKNNKVRMRKLRNALVERMTDVSLDRAMENNPELRLFKPNYQLNDQSYQKNREIRDKDIAQGLSDRLNAAWEGTGVVIAETQKQWDDMTKMLRIPKDHQNNIAGFQNRDIIGINPQKVQADTKLHELSHIFVKSMKVLEPKRYALGLKLIQDSEYFERIKEEYASVYPDFETNQEMYADEALVTALGREGEIIFRTIAKKSAWDKFAEGWKTFFKDTFGTSYNPEMKLSNWLTDAAVDVIQGNGIVQALKKENTLSKERGEKTNAFFWKKGYGKQESTLSFSLNKDLAYDEVSPTNKTKFMIEEFTKLNPELQKLTWGKLVKNYPKEVEQMSKAALELGMKHGEKDVFNYWGARNQGQTQTEIDKARSEKLKGREAVNGIIHAVNNAPADVKKMMDEAFGGLSKTKQKERKAEVAAARIANLLEKNISELPVGTAKAFMEKVETLNPNAITWKGNKVNLTKLGTWDSSSAQVKNTAEMITELARWPKKVKDVYVENMRNVLAREPRIIGPALENIQKLDRYKKAILLLKDEGKMDAVQAKLALKTIEDNAIDRELEGKRGEYEKGFDTKQKDFNVQNVFDTIIDSLNVTPNPIETANLSPILDERKSNGSLEVLTDTNWKDAFGPGKYNKNPNLAKNQKTKELNRLKHSMDKQVVLKDMIVRITDAHKNGNISLETAWRMNWVMWHQQLSLGRSAAPRVYFDERAFTPGKLNPYTVEHIQPTETTKTMAFAAALTGNKAALDAVFDNFIIADVEKANDAYLNLNHIDMNNKTLKGIYDENFNPMGKIPGTTVPYSMIRYMNTQGTLNLFKLKKYQDPSVSVANELGIPSHFEEVFDKIDEGGQAEYKGIAYQIADNAAERNVIGADTADFAKEYDKYLKDRGGIDLDASLYNEGERRNIAYQKVNDNSSKIKDILGILNDPLTFKSGAFKKSKIDAATRAELEVRKELLADIGHTMSGAELQTMYASIQEIIKTGKSNAKAQAESLQQRKDDMQAKADELITQKTGKTGTVTADDVGRNDLRKKTFLEGLSNIRQKTKLSRLLAPRSNNDFFGLLYDLLPQGKNRKAAQAWQKDNIIDPLNDANYEYGEAKYGMQQGQEAALNTFAKANGFKNAKAAKSELEKPNTGIVIGEGKTSQELSKAQLVRIFNHLKDPALFAQLNKALSTTDIKKIVDYMTLGNESLLGLSKDILANYHTASEVIHSKMNARGYRGVNKYRITDADKKANPLLDQIYSGETIPEYAPYSPMTTTAEAEVDFTDMFGGTHTPYSTMSGQLKQRAFGGAYTTAGQDMFSDLQGFIGPSGALRSSAFLDFAQNMSGFMSKENLQKAQLSGKLGDVWVSSMKDSMRRIVTGRNRPSDLGKTEKVLYDWVNGSVAAVMFFNTRSAVLQLLSTANYLVQNPGAVMGGLGATIKDPKILNRAWKAMSKSAWFNERGKGATQLEMEEIFSQDKTTVFGSKRMGKILQTAQKHGYSLTKYGDKAAIALGGAPFVAGRIAHYEKQGMTAKEAEIAAVKDFIASAEEAQQSSRAERLGQEQTGKFGRIVLAFANTPQQYNRLMSRALQDFTSAVKTGDAKGAAHATAKVAYFGVIQNAMFTFLQGALFKVLGEDDEEEEAKINAAANSMLDTVLRGSGMRGALISTLKNLAFARMKRGKWDKAEIYKTIINTSPAIGSKAGHVTKIVQENIYALSDTEYSTETSDIYRAASAINVATNIPADRILKKYEAIADFAASDLETTDRWLRLAGWDRYTLGESTGDTVEDSDQLEDMREFFEEVFEDVRQ